MRNTKNQTGNSILREITISSLFVAILVTVNSLIHESIIPLKWICNYGIAFGVEIPQAIFLAMWFITMIVLLHLWLKAHRENSPVIYRYGLLFVITGALSNIIDRIIHGCVVDYIAIVPWNHFNLADASIFVGVMFVLYDAFFIQPKAVSHNTQD